MTLIPGTRLGVFEITGQIGEGGMGAVYRATDTSLSRQVAWYGRCAWWGDPREFADDHDARDDAIDMYPSFSPDGRWIAYVSSESGTTQVYVRAFPDAGGKWQISNSGGVNPTWSPAGHGPFFETDNHILVAAYTVKGDSFVADKPRAWSEQRIGRDSRSFHPRARTASASWH